MVIIKPSTTEMEKFGSSMIQAFRKDPTLAAKSLLKVEENPLILAEIQEIILQEFWYSKFSLLTATRGCGKSFCSAVYAILQCLLYPGTRIGIFAPGLRQAKLIFKEVERIYNSSPLLQDCIEKPPTQQTDQCICIFKPISRSHKPSEIVALPTGNDGSTIRGLRFKKIILDEIVHINEHVYRSVIVPMLSTAKNPMQKVLEIEKLKEEFGDDIINSLDTSSDNGYIGITSAYYQFNYWWEELKRMHQKIKSGSKSHSLRFVPYWELPDGFLDKDVVQASRENSPYHMFATEWEAKWISDSDGAFPMSLLESARSAECIPKQSKDLNKDKGKEYIFGIDVGRERDSTGIAIVELGYPSKLIHLVELEETPIPEQAKIIFQLVRQFNPRAINMDAGGGGTSIRDMLNTPETVGFSVSDRIIESDASLSATGKRILNMCNFTPTFIEDANNQSKTLLEQRAIKFPTAVTPIEKTRLNKNNKNETVDLVQEMINQITSVVITQTPSGKAHYDLPKKLSGSNDLGVRKKDLYTAFILAGKCVYDIQWKPRDIDTGAVPMGIITEINSPTKKIHGIILNGQDYGNNKVYVPGGGFIVQRDVRKRR